MKYLNSKLLMTALCLIAASQVFADENPGSFICKFEAVHGQEQYEGAIPITPQKMKSHPMKYADSTQEWVYRDEQVSVYVSLQSEDKGGFRASMQASPTDTRESTVSVLNLPGIHRYVTLDLDVPNGLKQNKYIRTLRLTCFNPVKSAELKAAGYLNFKE